MNKSKTVTTTKKPTEGPQEPVEGDVISTPAKIEAAEPEAKALVPAEEPNPQALSIIAGVTTNQLRSALEIQTEQRKLIADFIKKHLKKGTDFGSIHVVRVCPTEENKRGSCRLTYHFSKPILYKPGQEKIFSLFNIQSELLRDEETMQMLGELRGLVAYKCIARRGGEIVAEGRGAAVVGDNRRDANATIKIAEKRARMDACLSLGFSEYFAQDLDDPDYQQQKKMAEEQAASAAVVYKPGQMILPMRPANARMNEMERTALARSMIKLGITEREEQLQTLKANGITDPKIMTSGQARDMIKKLQDGSLDQPHTANPDPIDDDAIEANLDAAAEEIDKVPPPPEPEELVIDDDLKQHVLSDFATIGLNNWGASWFMKYVTGRPYGVFDKMTDGEWRKAFETVQAILEARLEVDDRYLDKSQAQLPVDPSEPKKNQKKAK